MRDLVATLAHNAQIFEAGRADIYSADWPNETEAETIKADKARNAAEAIKAEAPSLPDYFLPIV